MGSLKSALNRSTSGPTATTDEIKITRKRIDEMSSELTKLKNEVKLLLLLLSFIFYPRKISINAIYCLGCLAI